MGGHTTLFKSDWVGESDVPGAAKRHWRVRGYERARERRQDDARSKGRACVHAPSTPEETLGRYGEPDGLLVVYYCCSVCNVMGRVGKPLSSASMPATHLLRTYILCRWLGMY